MTVPNTAGGDSSPAAGFTPRTMELAGYDVPLAYDGTRMEYEALRTSAIVVDRSFRGRLRFFGDKAADALTGLVTTDVHALKPGHGGYGAALTAKGRIVADIRIFASTDSYLVDTPPRASAAWVAMIKKYVNPRLARYRDESHALRDIGVFGREARRITAAISGADAETLGALGPNAHVAAPVLGDSAIVVRSSDIGVEGYELMVPFEAFNDVWSRLVDAGAVRAGLRAWEIARVEAGRPEWGLDIDDTTLPQEANFDELDAISYTKGCYIGQEVVARVHFRGHVNRHLRGLRTVSPLAGTDGVPSGAQLVDNSGNHVGDVRSAVVSPRFGPIALGMVRREIEPGASLNARWDGGDGRVDVVSLPFPV